MKKNIFAILLILIFAQPGIAAQKKSKQVLPATNMNSKPIRKRIIHLLRQKKKNGLKDQLAKLPKPIVKAIIALPDIYGNNWQIRVMLRQ